MRTLDFYQVTSARHKIPYLNEIILSLMIVVMKSLCRQSVSKDFTEKYTVEKAFNYDDYLTCLRDGLKVNDHNLLRSKDSFDRKQSIDLWLWFFTPCARLLLAFRKP